MGLRAREQSQVLVPYEAVSRYEAEDGEVQIQLHDGVYPCCDQRWCLVSHIIMYREFGGIVL